MLFAFVLDFLERFAAPLGIAFAVVLTLAVPSLRRDFMKSQEAGRNFRETHKTLARAFDVVGVLLILGVVAYFILK